MNIRWTNHNIDYLIKQYGINGKPASNKILANLCSWEFGRDVSDGAVKGQIDRQRKHGRLPKYRPGFGPDSRKMKTEESANAD
jgi:hypothetical protein